MLSNMLMRKSRDDRKADRLALRMTASLRETGLTKFDVTVIDMSTTGYRIETVYRLDIGARVWLTIPGLCGLESEVSWTDYRGYGCHFICPLHIAVFEHVVAPHIIR